MKNLIIPSLLFSLLTASCGSQSESKNASATNLKTEAIAPIAKIRIPRDSILTLTLPTAPQQSYSIYYPSTAGPAENTPVILFFDPHSAGSLPVEKYKKLASHFGVAIAGSNNSKNGMSLEDGKQIAAGIESDLIDRLGFAKKNMTLAGFSGGAKVALNAAFNDVEIVHAIYMGAAIPYAAHHPLSLMGFAGQQDMNYTDLVSFDESVNQSKPGTAVLIEHAGKHEWPDAAVLEKAFYWLALQTGGQDSIRFKKIVSECIAKENQHIGDANITKHKIGLLNAFEENKVAIFILDKVSDISQYKKNIEMIAQDKAYQAAVNEKKQVLNAEASTKQMLMQSFQIQGPDWWAKVIAGYKSSKNPSDKRLLGFISLACYSYSNQTLQSHNVDAAEKILAIYELCDATNTDQLYYHAMLYAQKGNTELALKYIDKAVANGYNDRQKIENDQSFITIKGDPRFAQILASLGKKTK